ncbi:hypothetical protein HYALB_00001734 [Hymenoscyphus albidus]|uniref:Uncharacterized protein n=1 Tax=Hymenoscyphus albidus TaxID=595503 RepID=A0A9N9Q3N9_9HELO|nr:hypothetical protein HYALB_00001734 [Hymenoscyphus albidus]
MPEPATRQSRPARKVRAPAPDIIDLESSSPSRHKSSTMHTPSVPANDGAGHEQDDDDTLPLMSSRPRNNRRHVIDSDSNEERQHDDQQPSKRARTDMQEAREATLGGTSTPVDGPVSASSPPVPSHNIQEKWNNDGHEATFTTPTGGLPPKATSTSRTNNKITKQTPSTINPFKPKIATPTPRPSQRLSAPHSRGQPRTVSGAGLQSTYTPLNSGTSQRHSSPLVENPVSPSPPQHYSTFRRSSVDNLAHNNQSLHAGLAHDRLTLHGSPEGLGFMASQNEIPRSSQFGTPHRSPLEHPQFSRPSSALGGVVQSMRHAVSPPPVPEFDRPSASSDQLRIVLQQQGTEIKSLIQQVRKLQYEMKLQKVHVEYLVGQLPRRG